jgi:hypothetical protein
MRTYLLVAMLMAYPCGMAVGMLLQPSLLFVAVATAMAMSLAMLWVEVGGGAR